MSIKDYFKEDKRDKGLWGIEIVMLIYMGFTTLLTLYYGHNLVHFNTLLLMRAAVFAGIGLLYLLWKKFPCRAVRILRYTGVLSCLLFLYGETYDFASQLPYQDHIFASIDWYIFGYQPSLEFIKAVPDVFWHEAFYMGYYSYYYLMFAALMYYVFYQYDKSNKMSFIFLSSFFLYYVIYIFLPVSGPYYYFQAIGIEKAASGVYPDLGYYFQTHTEMLPFEVKGVFSRIVNSLHETEEFPTAAFPSSHVGMGTISMMIMWNAKIKWPFLVMMPFYVLLCIATVYIQAHYFIDTIGGFVCAVAFYYLTKWIFERYLEKK